MEVALFSAAEANGVGKAATIEKTATIRRKRPMVRRSTATVVELTRPLKCLPSMN